MVTGEAGNGLPLFIDKFPRFCGWAPRSATTAGIARIEPARTPRRQVLAIVGLVIVGKHRQRAWTGRIIDGRLTSDALARTRPAGTDGGREIRPLLGRPPGRGVGQIQVLRPRAEVTGMASAATMLRGFPGGRLRRHARIRCSVGRLCRRRIRWRPRHGTLRLRGRSLLEARLRRSGHRPLRLRDRSLLRRLTDLRRGTVRCACLWPAGDDRGRRNLRPGLAKPPTPRRSSPHATGGLHARLGRCRRRRHALAYWRIAGRALGNWRRRSLPGRRISLGTLCFREGRTCRLAGRGQVGHGLSSCDVGAARAPSCCARGRLRTHGLLGSCLLSLR